MSFLFSLQTRLQPTLCPISWHRRLSRVKPLSSLKPHRMLSVRISPTLMLAPRQLVLKGETIASASTQVCSIEARIEAAGTLGEVVAVIEASSSASWIIAAQPTQII